MDQERNERGRKCKDGKSSKDMCRAFAGDFKVEDWQRHLG